MYSLAKIFSRSAALLVGVALLTCGCGGTEKPKLTPVSGKVSVDGEPLTVGTVTFYPDDQKGNTSKWSATGMIDSSGNYQLTTDGSPGAPVGWYKVTVSATGMPTDGMGTEVGSTPGDPMKALGKGKSKTSVNQKYQVPATSGISIEVVEKAPPGAYDLKVTK